jgi:regulator of nonsense transcripts 3
MLGDLIRAATFHDAAKSWQDPALIGPPTLEVAPYTKVAGGRRRNDNRQGTIDQDPDFKDFLESLTNPITKAAAPEGDAQKREKVKTTPLIEALREKKANKDKSSAKGVKTARGEAKEDAADKKVLPRAGKENALNAGDKNRRINKADKVQAAKDAVKILNKEASSAKDTVASASTDKPTAGPAAERKRGNVAGVKSLLQRDLGIGAAPNRRRGTKREVGPATPDAGALPKNIASKEQKPEDAPPSAAPSSDKTSHSQKKERPTRAERRAFKATLTDKSNDKTTLSDATSQTPTKPTTVPAPQILKKPQLAQAPTAPKGPAAAARSPPTEPTAARNIASPAQTHSTPAKTVVAPAPKTNQTARSAPPNPIPAPTSKQSFLKHANPSQGITEALIEEALKVFGGIERVEIDKRKGFAYVDFAEPEGLQKAMAASPIKIAQGAVQVLERKEKTARTVNPRFNGPLPTGSARGGLAGRGAFAPRGRGRGTARGGGPVPANTASAVSAAGSSESTPSVVIAAPPAPTPAPSTESAI